MGCSVEKYAEFFEGINKQEFLDAEKKTKIYKFNKTLNRDKWTGKFKQPPNDPFTKIEHYKEIRLYLDRIKGEGGSCCEGMSPRRYAEYRCSQWDLRKGKDGAEKGQLPAEPVAGLPKSCNGKIVKKLGRNYK